MAWQLHRDRDAGQFWSSGTITTAIAVVVLLVIGLWTTLAGSSHHKPNLGAFNPPAGAKARPLGEVGPGACWPSKTFDNKDGVAQAVLYLSGKNSHDTGHTAYGVAARDQAWLAKYSSYYGYKPGESDATWTNGLVEEQLTTPIQVQNTYCPKGQNVVAKWQVQTLPKGEWVFFKKGHAPSDVRKDSKVKLIPVKKGVCGNFLSPPPVSSVPTTTSTASKPPIPPVHSSSPPTCIPTSTSVENGCNGKQVKAAPSYTRIYPIVQPPSGGYVDRGGVTHSGGFTPSPAPPAKAGAGSGKGAISTVPKPSESASPAPLPSPQPVQSSTPPKP